MKVVVQRVISASVEVSGKVISKIGKGLLAFIAFEEGDTQDTLEKICDKLVNLRVIDDGTGFLNRSIIDTKDSIMLVPNFTVAGDTSHGRRPSFDNALDKEIAQSFYEIAINYLRKYNIPVGFGEFGADMKIFLVNDGPVTLILEK